MQPWKYGAASCLLLAYGCVDSVTLGRECFRLGDCPMRVEPPSPTDASLAEDAGRLEFLDGASLDAGPLEASAEPIVDAGRALPLPIANGAFELTGGQYGGLAFEVFEPIPLGANVSSPWAACRFGFNVLQQADSVRGSGAGDVRPRDGVALIEGEVDLSVGPSGLQQRLTTPLVSGEAYAFRIDARAAVGSAVTLELRGSNVSCAAGTLLADLGTLSEAWTSPCIRFVAPADFGYVTLLPASRGLSSSAPARVFFDALRECD